MEHVDGTGIVLGWLLFVSWLVLRPARPARPAGLLEQAVRALQQIAAALGGKL